MDNRKDYEDKLTNFTASQKEKSARITAPQNKQEDDESGGGRGKTHKGFFKGEKLEKLINQGKLDAKQFWRFLSANHQDSHSVKESTLEKFAKEHEEKTDKLLDHQEAEQQVEKTKALQMESDDDNHVIQETPAEEITENKKAHAEDTSKTNSQNQAQLAKETAERNKAAIQAITDNKTAGSIIGAVHGNSLGFKVQNDNGAVIDPNQVRNDNALQGKAALFGTQANHQGFTVHRMEAGLIGSVLTDNVKNQQEKQALTEKNISRGSSKSR